MLTDQPGGGSVLRYLLAITSSGTTIRLEPAWQRSAAALFRWRWHGHLLLPESEEHTPLESVALFVAVQPHISFLACGVAGHHVFLS